MPLVNFPGSSFKGVSIFPGSKFSAVELGDSKFRGSGAQGLRQVPGVETFRGLFSWVQALQGFNLSGFKLQTFLGFKVPWV